MASERASPQAFFGASALLFAAFLIVPPDLREGLAAARAVTASARR
jgi:hypothetical protein